MSTAGDSEEFEHNIVALSSARPLLKEHWYCFNNLPSNDVSTTRFVVETSKCCLLKQVTWGSIEYGKLKHLAPYMHAAFEGLKTFILSTFLDPIRRLSQSL